MKLYGSNLEISFDRDQSKPDKRAERHWQATLAALTGICARPDTEQTEYDEVTAEALEQADELMRQYRCPGEKIDGN